MNNYHTGRRVSTEWLDTQQSGIVHKCAYPLHLLRRLVFDIMILRCSNLVKRRPSLMNRKTIHSIRLNDYS